LDFLVWITCCRSPHAQTDTEGETHRDTHMDTHMDVRESARARTKGAEYVLPLKHMTKGCP
jgi:hypothetical protein